MNNRVALSRPDAKIFLVGFMGTGKTTLGRMLADRLGWDFQDIDTVIEDTEGASIVRIFAEKGEAHFRELETRTLEHVAEMPRRAVIACGGGTFCAAENEELMTGHGITVWLDQPFDQIWERRVDLAVKRPLLRGRRELQALYEERVPFYSRASFRLPLSEGGLTQALETLIQWLQDEG